MKVIIRILFFLISIIFTNIIGQTRNIEFRDLPKDSLLIIARKIIETDITCTFITVDEKHQPQARVLAYFPPEDDWIIWLGTSTNSRKIKQVKNNPSVMVFYYDQKGRSYVSIAGKAKIVNDPELKKKYWKDGWKVYYPNPEKDYVLVKVIPEKMEICSYKYKLFWDEEGKPGFIEF